MLAHRAGILPWAFEGAWDVMLWNDVVSQVAGANGEERAIRHVLSWAQSHEESFHGRERTDRSGHSVPPMGGWAGKWDHEYEWSEICFFPSVLKGILEEAAFDYDGILSAWKERGWLDTNKSPGHYTKVSWIDSKSTRLVVIKRAGVEAAEAI